MSSHDGDWTYYKQRVRLQAAVIDQLKSLLEAYGYYLPEVGVVRVSTTRQSCVWYLTAVSGVRNLRAIRIICEHE